MYYQYSSSRVEEKSPSFFTFCVWFAYILQGGVCNIDELKDKKVIIVLLGKQIIRKNTMTKRHRDLRSFLLESFPTQDDIHIVTSKLPTNKLVLPASLLKKKNSTKLETKSRFQSCHVNYNETDFANSCQSKNSDKTSKQDCSKYSATLEEYAKFDEK